MYPQGRVFDAVISQEGGQMGVTPSDKADAGSLTSEIQNIREDVRKLQDIQKSNNAGSLTSDIQNIREDVRKLQDVQKSNNAGSLTSEIQNIREDVRKLQDVQKSNTLLSNDIQRILGVLGKVREDLEKAKWSPDPMCSTGWTYYGLSCYYLSSNTQPWNAAKKDCEDKDAYLLVINGKGEMVSMINQSISLLTSTSHILYNGIVWGPEGATLTVNDGDDWGRKCVDFLSGVITGKTVWIGLTDVDGSWKWLDGMPYDITPKFWDSGQPDDWTGHDFGGGEDCATLELGGTWNDDHCSQSYQYICEKKMF
ncbi:C-type lectin domain family 10 member A-like [Mantella aurantiaca]